MKQLADHITFRHGAETANRIVQTPMLTNSGVDEMVTETTLDYYAQRSHSAGIVIANTQTHPSTAAFPEAGRITSSLPSMTTGLFPV